MPTGIYDHKPHSEETKQKIQDKHKGRRLSPKSEFKKGHNRTKLDKHPRWKGGIVKDVHGYIWVKVPNHPNSRGKGAGYVRQHRLIMEKHIGRFLKNKEVVHHVNFNKSDNRIKNLKLFKNDSDHRKFHYSLITKTLKKKDKINEVKNV